MLSHRALVAELDQAAAVVPPMVRAGDTVLGVLPLWRAYGLQAVLGAALRSRATLVLAEGLDAVDTLDRIARSACTVVPLAPAVLTSWLDLEADRVRLALATVRTIVSGPAPLPADVVERLAALTGVPVHQGYGSAEAGAVVTSTLASDDPVPGSLGAPLPGVGLRLVDEDGRPSAPGDPGEIEVCGARVFSGYWPGGDGPGPDGWWRTGDVGLVDARGDLTLVDRVRDLAVVSGFHVYPAEVEAALLEVEGVVEAAVVGVPDPAAGEAVVAYLRSDLPGTSYDALVAAAVEHCARRLARFKRPRRVEVVDGLPRAATGEVDKRRLRGTVRRGADGPAR